MMIAWASWGILTPREIDIVILTSEGRGSIALIVPTGTPRIRT